MSDRETMKPRFSHRLEALGLDLVSLLLGPLGWRGTQRLGRAIGGLGYRLTKIRVNVARENVERAFGGSLDRPDVDRLLLETYRNWGATFLEFARLRSMGPDDVRRVVRFDGREKLDRLADEGKGAILFTGHFGNFDLFGASIAANGYPLTILVQRQSNRIIEDQMRRTREKMGSKVIYRGAGVREIFRTFRRNGFVAILGDQDAREGGVFVDFLGVPASTPGGPAQLAWRFGVPILFGVLERGENGGHIVRWGQTIRADRSRPEKEEVRRITQELADMLSEEVRRRPDHYFWPHRRWKTNPPPDGEGP